jgi:asparagine synthase (glutamine-hydrolysing)
VCGIVAVAAAHEAQTVAERGIRTLHHRGPDAAGVWTEAVQGVALGHARLSIVDLSDAGRQPMVSADGRYVLTFNGEIYNYVELREELADYPFRSRTDSEVLLAAWCRWGERALDRLVGMFAFVVWDTVERRLVAVRDRFGVKPLYIAELPSGGVALASEIKALHVMGVPIVDDETTWATFLCTGLTDFSIRTFWRDIRAVEAGTYVEWSADRGTRTTRWYDLAARVGPDLDRRSEADVKAEYRALLESSVRLRFRSDVPVAINLSGGVDSSVLLGLVHAVQGPDSDVNVFTFATGDPQYDELPWVRSMLERTKHPLVPCILTPDEVPELAAKIADVEDEPYGGLPTLAYSKIFAEARARGVIVLLDGNGLDEQWAGYDYYVNAVVGARDAGIVQGTTTSPPVLSDVISPDLRARSIAFTAPERFPDRLRNLQLRDALATKIPRGLRFNDRISMAASTELREPFLDHRLFELALRQPQERKLRSGTTKYLLRELASDLVPDGVRLAPKRPVQTPQREWLRGPLRSWADALIDVGLRARAGWFDVGAARAAWQAYQNGEGNNSYWVWQWLSIGLLAQRRAVS